MEEYHFSYNGATLHFSKSGKGQRILLAFHGFGQNHQVFDGLDEKFSELYTLYSFDLFFHGKSVWSNGEVPLEKTFWRNLLIEFLRQNKIDRFSLLGFSMGGKFALASLEAFPEKIDKVFLLAPDGVMISRWYTLATFTSVTRQLFKSMILRPNHFKFIANLAVNVGFIDKGVLRFAESQMNTEAKRQQVYLSWVVFRHLKFKMETIAHCINANNVDLTVVIGKHDKIITAKNMNGLLSKMPNHTIEILETGHNGLIAKWSDSKSFNS